MMNAKDMASFHDAINTLLDLADAYRAAALERGYSPTVAELMAEEYHRGIVRQIFTAATKT